MQFLENVRTCVSVTGGKLYVDFTTLETLTPAGALLLVAEFDRWREIVEYQRLQPIKLDRWDPTVKARLTEMGFFTLLNSTEPVESEERCDPETGDRFVPFLSGHRSEGEKARELRLSIERLGHRLAEPNALFQGLTEAMTNVQQHAYDGSAAVKRWWMSASVNSSGRKLRVMFVDHGLGIPKTLHPDLIESVRAAAARVSESWVKNDARLIEAAVKQGRSSTRDSHRGNGLHQDIQGYIENHDTSGTLRIVSGRGKYTYNKQHGVPGRASTHSLPVTFKGTFIEWIIEDFAEGDRNDQQN
ncbi:sensor histidine kinase [Oleiagrimonas sp. C23AA]|uniref:sensor histidine kinase n=1 Tax=Oleiagrimonas sp. C23AA TaxID=2719047 RepID=UPI0014225669|nr:sensor histidine kinase [Oleiagrimonas sp. C23AA]NII09981.1 sensor histidine kinase [Oleiagrimonas sp. C23AA]